MKGCGRRSGERKWPGGVKEVRTVGRRGRMTRKVTWRDREKKKGHTLFYRTLIRRNKLHLVSK